MLGLSGEAWGGIGTVVGTISATATFLYGRISAGDKRAHDLEADQTKKDLERLDASQKASWVVLDDLRFNAVRKQDQDKLREEFRSDMRALGDRLEAAISALRDDIHRERPSGT